VCGFDSKQHAFDCDLDEMRTLVDECVGRKIVGEICFVAAARARATSSLFILGGDTAAAQAL